MTGTETLAEERSDVYDVSAQCEQHDEYLMKLASAVGTKSPYSGSLVVNKRRPKHSFAARGLTPRPTGALDEG
jgi:hypothetical protein